MMLSDGDLQGIMEAGCLDIVPAGTMQPASIDLTLSNEFLIFEDMGVIWPQGVATTKTATLGPKEHLGLPPGNFVLASTVECIGLCDEYAARVEGKSSLGRLGLMVHSTAGFIDPGFRGQITLELSNVNNSAIMLTPGMAIAQLCVFELKSRARKPYGHPDNGNRYQGQQGPTASRSWMGSQVGSHHVAENPATPASPLD